MKKKNLKKEKILKKKESHVYVQLSPEEFAKSKRDILSYQLELLNIIKAMKRYSLLREAEISMKIKLQSMLREVGENLRKIKSNLPEVEEPHLKQKNKPIKTPSIEYYDHDLESQLESIRRKLEEIGR